MKYAGDTWVNAASLPLPVWAEEIGGKARGLADGRDRGIEYR